MTPPWSLLCLTDLHYGSESYADNAKKTHPGHNSLRDNIFENFHRIIDGFDPKSIDLIAVGGDITTAGTQSGLDAFKENAIPRLKSLVRNTSKNYQAICLVPGNHDVPRGLDPAKSYDDKFKAFMQLVKNTGVTSCLFPTGPLTESSEKSHRMSNLAFISALGNQHDSSGPLYVDPDRKILALCINSAVRCHEVNVAMRNDLTEIAHSLGVTTDHLSSFRVNKKFRKFREKLWDHLVRDVAHVTVMQNNVLSDILKHEKKTLGAKEWDRYLKVAILHHSLVPFLNQATEHAPYAQMLDSSQILQTLMTFDFDIAITGHKHQPHQEKYGDDQDKTLVIIGGTTLGSADVSRGIRYIEVSDKDGKRYFKIADISHQDGIGEVHNNIDRCIKSAKSIVVDRSAKEFDHRCHEKGFYYKSVTSMARLDMNGTAERTLEYSDLIYLNADCKRRVTHIVNVPPTSGEISRVRAQYANSREIPVDLETPQGARTPTATLNFRPMIGVPPEDYKPDQSQGYRMVWWAVNGVALNKQQWAYKYPPITQLPRWEFTHFTPDEAEPIEELTIVVQFPAPRVGLQSQPEIRAVQEVKGMPARNWPVDSDALAHLRKRRALKYFDSLGIATLSVRYPQPGLSYGIEWQVMDMPEDYDNRDQDKIDKLWGHLNLKADHLTEDDRSGLLSLLGEIIDWARGVIFKHGKRDSAGTEWGGPIDAGIMYFDGRSSLVRLIAVTQEQKRGKLNELNYDKKLKYGEGIAGMAFKTNRRFIYADKDQQRQDRPDLYVPILKNHRHTVLISLPLHVPVDPELDSEGESIYGHKPPYAILSLGSTSSECPLANREDPGMSIDGIPAFQQYINSLVWTVLSGFLLQQEQSKFSLDGHTN